MNGHHRRDGTFPNNRVSPSLCQAGLGTPSIVAPLCIPPELLIQPRNHARGVDMCVTLKYLTTCQPLPRQLLSLLIPLELKARLSQPSNHVQRVDMNAILSRSTALQLPPYLLSLLIPF